MTFPEACSFLGRDLPPPSSLAGKRSAKPSWEPRVTAAPGDTWQAKARKLVDDSVHNLWDIYDKLALDFLIKKRGLTEATIKEFSLGCILFDQREPAPEWGLEEVLKDAGKAKKLWFPRGHVIPLCTGDQVLRVRIRRPKSAGDPRFFLVRGSDTRAMILGTDKPVSIVVESELDALLLYQEVGALVNVVALGSAQIRPDQQTADLFNQSQLILVSLDADPAGAAESWGWWKKHYLQARRWPPLGGKDIGDMLAAGVNIRTWIEAGLTEYKDVAAQPERPLHLAGAEEESVFEEYQPVNPTEEEHVLIDGTCFFHHCELASYQNAALFCGETQQLVLDMACCPLSMWHKGENGWPVERQGQGL
jgi:DNA primase